MSDRDKNTPVEIEPEPEAEELGLGELGAVFGGWHPGPPAPEPPASTSGGVGGG